MLVSCLIRLFVCLLDLYPGVELLDHMVDLFLAVHFKIILFIYLFMTVLGLTATRAFL